MDRPADIMPPPMLRAAFLVRNWGLEVLDADYDTAQQMSYLMHIYEVKRKVRNAKGAQIHALTDAERRTLAVLRKKGLL